MCRSIARTVMAAVLACGSSAAPAWSAPADWVPAVSAIRAPRIEAFATAQSSGLVAIAAARSGSVSGLAAMPGDAVAAGQEIARVGGPRIAAAQARAEAMLASARAAEHAALVSLSVDQDLLEHRLTTTKTVARDTSALAAATAQIAIARANLELLRQTEILRSPVAGVVRDVTSANGDVVAAGTPVASIQPTTGTWLKAVLFTPDARATQPGAPGVFIPANGAAPVQVTVRGLLGVARSDGGIPVALTTAASLTPGAFGTVALTLPPRKVTMVPSDALILDKSRWWVMVHDAGGDHAVPVIPGPAEGFNTVIESGLSPGERVIVVNAYLRYHRGIAALYQPPD